MSASTALPEPGEMPRVSTPDQPVGPRERVVALDFVRGVAVLGILFSNVVAYGHPRLAYYWPDALPGGASAFDRWVWLFQLVLVDGKFRGVFTLLFGAGLYLFAERTRARGGTGALQMRRLAWLALFGLAHLFLVWTGDILWLYAFTGFGALLLLDWPARVQLGVGIAWFLAGAALLTVLYDPAQVAGSESWYIEAAAHESAIMRDGTYADILRYRLADEGPGLLDQTLFLAIVETLPLMLIGMGLYRLGLFADAFDRARLLRWGAAAFIGGGLLTLPLGLWVMAGGFELSLTQWVFNGLTAFLHLPMTLGLVALLTALAPAAARGWLGTRFVAAGRMAFSNYVGTSLVMMLLFQGWAGDSFGEWHRGTMLLVVALGWLAMLAWSAPWLAHFRYGPLEWLWRCLTYWRWFAIKR
jgi:uncharacterized protein